MNEKPSLRARVSGPLTALAMAAAFALLGAAPAAAQSAADVARGAELYARTCNRCHDARSPMERTDRQWATIMAHMRTRANLTKEEADAIMAFLQATNAPEGGQSASALEPGDMHPASSKGTDARARLGREVASYVADLRAGNTPRADRIDGG